MASLRKQVERIKKHGAYKPKQTNVFNPICTICGSDLRAVTSNGEAATVIRQHKRVAHPGLDIL